MGSLWSSAWRSLPWFAWIDAKHNYFWPHIHAHIVNIIVITSFCLFLWHKFQFNRFPLYCGIVASDRFCEFSCACLRKVCCTSKVMFKHWLMDYSLTCFCLFASKTTSISLVRIKKRTNYHLLPSSRWGLRPRVAQLSTSSHKLLTRSFFYLLLNPLVVWKFVVEKPASCMMFFWSILREN